MPRDEPGLVCGVPAVDCGQAMSHCNRPVFRQAPGRATQARVGHIVVRARLSARRSATVDFLVDTGATHSIVPPALARKVGAPTLPQRFEVSLADGRRRRLKACSMSVSVGGRTGPTIALLLPGSDPLLGVETLEALGLKVNHERRRLEPSRVQTALLVGPTSARPLGAPIDEATRATEADGAPAALVGFIGQA